MMGWSRIVLLLAGVLGLAAQAAGQVSLSLPLQGYYRPGRYMPVELNPTGDESVDLAALVLQADEPNAVPTQITGGWGRGRHNVPHELVPVLMLSDRAAHLNQLPLHALVPDQRLVALLDASIDDAAGKQVFPGMTIIPMRIDASLLASENNVYSLGALDAIIMVDWPKDPQQQENLHQLRVDGITLVLTGAIAAPDNYPWKKAGSLWFCRPPNFLPPVICPAAYEPVLGWNPGRPLRFRTQVVIIGVVCTLLLGLVSIIKKRWMPTALMIFAAGLACGVHYWNRHQPVTTQAIGIVTLTDGPGAYSHDHWFYYSSAADDKIGNLPDDVHPVFYDQGQLAAARPRLVIGQSGAAHLVLQNMPGFPLAVLATMALPQPDVTNRPQPATSGGVPIARLAVPVLYPGWRLDGESTHWLSVGGATDFGQVRLQRVQP